VGETVGARVPAVQRSASDSGFSEDTVSRATGRVLDGALARARWLHGGENIWPVGRFQAMAG
jgi:hypothetical protein